MCFCCCFGGFYLWWISLQHPTDSGSRILMKSAILLSERVTSDYNPVLSYFLPITTFQWVSRILHLAFVAFFQPLLIAIPGQIPVHPGWVVCAIWINGSELLDLACFVSNLTYPADEKERSLEDSDRERLNGCTFNNAFCRTNLGI